jgi:hypothetical protein
MHDVEAAIGACATNEKTAPANRGGQVSGKVPGPGKLRATSGPRCELGLSPRVGHPFRGGVGADFGVHGGCASEGLP